MALASGKQLRDGSLALAKVYTGASQGAHVFATGTMLGITDAPVNATDLVNKAYVDASKHGMDWKDSVVAATTANITLSGTQTIDGIALSADKRVLVKNQTAPAENGLYLVNAGAWVRTPDADNSGGSEVTTGLCCLVEQGTVNGGRGYLLSTTGTIVLGTTALTFIQFTAAGAYTSGNGIAISGQVISVNLASNSGLTLGSGALAVNSTIAGNGLTWTAGVLSVNTIDLADNGGDVSGILGTMNGGTGSQIDAGLVGNGDLLIGNAGTQVFDKAALTEGTGIYASVGAGTLEIGIANNGVSVAQINIGSPTTGKVIGWNGTALVWLTNTDDQQISGNDNGDGTYTVSLTGDNVSSATFNIATLLDDVTIDSFGDVTISSPSNGQVLRYNGATWVNATLAAANVSFSNAGTGLGSTTVQAAIAELKGLIDALVAGALSVDGTDKNQDAQDAEQDEWSGAIITAQPDGFVMVYVNGILQRLAGDKTQDCYFTADDGATASLLNAINPTDKLYWLSDNAGFTLEATDIIDLIYET